MKTLLVLEPVVTVDENKTLVLQLKDGPCVTHLPVSDELLRELIQARMAIGMLQEWEEGAEDTTAVIRPVRRPLRRVTGRVVGRSFGKGRMKRRRR